MVAQEEITTLLHRAQHGDEKAFNTLFPIVYKELRKTAHHIRFRMQSMETMNTTAVVHEAYLRMAGKNSDFENRKHFYCVAAKAMRQILLNAATARSAQKRGGEQNDIPLDDVDYSLSLPEKTGQSLIKLHEALKKLENMDEQKGKIVEYRFFAGLSIEETANALNISVSTVKRNWNVAKAWLFTELKA